MDPGSPASSSASPRDLKILEPLQTLIHEQAKSIIAIKVRAKPWFPWYVEPTAIDRYHCKNTTT
jgi:hypothetical protein